MVTLDWGKIIRFMTVRTTEALVVLLLLMFMPSIPPYCKISDPKPVTPVLPLEGKLALNEMLNEVVVWHKGDVDGPEAFADYNGVLYSGLQTGEVVKFVDDRVVPVVKFGQPCQGFHEEKICGRPLGLEFDKDGSLVVLDAYYGIFRVDINTGAKIQLVSLETEIDGVKPMLPNSLAIHSSGDIYWSDSSTEFHLENGLFDTFADGSGRLIHYDVKTKKNTVLIKELQFANGVALSDDEEFVIVAESSRSCVHRYYLKGPKKGTSDIFVDGLPGLPDNINSDGHGGFFLPLVIPRDDYTPIPNQVLGTWPLLRRLAARMMGLAELGFSVANQIYSLTIFEKIIHLIGHFSVVTFVLPSRVTIVHVSKSGEIIGSFHANNRKVIAISEAYIFKDELYIGSAFNDYIARIPLKKLGLEKPPEKPKAVPTTPKPKATAAPTTSPPTKATTAAPTTTKPTTKATTPKPVTQAPTTAKPATEAPTTAKPATQAPTTAKPITTAKPTTTTTKSQEKPEAAAKSIPEPAKPTQPSKTESKSAAKEEKSKPSPNALPK